MEVFGGSPDSDRLTAEVLILGQALGVGAGQLAGLFITRGIYLCTANRRPEGLAYFREAARLATQVGDNQMIGRVQLNMSDVLATTDPADAAEAARTAIEHLRRAGDRNTLVVALINLANALLLLGDWDVAEAELARAIESGLAWDDFLICYSGLLSALRGDASAASAALSRLSDLRASEDVQDRCLINAAEAFAAAARGDQVEALRLARAAVAYADVLGISFEMVRWAWPLAVRTAFELRDTDAARELITLLDSHQPGHLAGTLRAERDLARARLADREGDPGATAAFAVAVASLHEQSTPYHLAHGLLDHADYLTRHGDAEGAALAIDEARAIGRRLGCRPLLARADAIEGAPVLRGSSREAGLDRADASA